MIRSIDNQNVSCRVPESLRGAKSAESSADDDNPRSRHWSGNSLLETSRGQCNSKNEKNEQHAVRSRRPEGKRAKLRENLDRDRTVCMRVKNDACDEFTDS